MTNSEVANLLRQVASAYEVKGESRFKVVAYQKAADAIEHATSEIKDLWEENSLNRVAGIGPSIKGHLDELFRTGKVKHFDSVMKNLPEGMFLLIGIPGVGPKIAYRLASKLHIKNVSDLKKAAHEGKIRKLEGFGEKSEQEILQNLSLQKKKIEGKRMLLTYATEVADQIIAWLKKSPDVVRADVLGSLRRQVSTVGDIDVACSTTSPSKVIKHFTSYPRTSKIIEAGTRTASVRLESGIQIDLMVYSPKGYGALLQHFTGSKHHNIKLREVALSKGLSLSDYGIKAGRKLETFETEEALYRRLGMQWVPPEIREDNGEIELAQKNKLPKLVTIDQIKGDIHLHSSYPIEPSHDYGTGSLEEIVKKAIEIGYEYVGLSDHSPAVSTHNEKEIYNLVKKRSEKIEDIKSSYKSIRVLNLLEVDILSDGKMALNDQSMDLLDGSIAGIHSSFSQDKKILTKRMTSAIKNPYVSVIAHPTGRLLNQRQGYEVYWPEVFETCLKYNKVLEINAWPNRLDLTDTLVFEAVSAGVKLIIDTDAHDISQMQNMRFGVAVARRGWAKPIDVINTYPWLEFKKYFRVK